VSYTKGPWVAEGSRVYGQDKFGQRCGVGWTDESGVPGDPEDEANARLVAAAPSLLEAAQHVLSMEHPDLAVALELRAAVAAAVAPEPTQD